MVALKWSMKNTMASSRARPCSGPPPTSAGSSATPISAMLRCCTAATTVLYEGKPVGTPDAGAFWRVIAEHQVSAPSSPRPPRFRAIKKEDPEGEAGSSATSCAPSARCSWPASAPIPRPSNGRETQAGRAGGRPLVADRDRLGDLRQSCRAWVCCPSKHGSPTVPMPGYRPAGAGRAVAIRSSSRRDRHARRQAAPAARPACRRCGTTPSASARATSRISPATTPPRTPATSTRTATST